MEVERALALALLLLCFAASTRLVDTAEENWQAVLYPNITVVNRTNLQVSYRLTTLSHSLVRRDGCVGPGISFVNRSKPDSE